MKQKGKLQFDDNENDYVTFDGNRKNLFESLDLHSLIGKKVSAIIKNHKGEAIYQGKGLLDRKWIGGKLKKYYIGNNSKFDDVLWENVDGVVSIEIDKYNKELKENVL
jgi:hypothetical protein